MKKSAKVRMAAVILTAFFVMSGCDGVPTSSDGSDIASTGTALGMGSSGGSSMASLAGETSTLEEIRAKQQMIAVYSIDSTSMSTVPNTSVVDASDGLDEMDVLKACAQNFIDQDATADFKSASRDGNKLVVDISTDTPGTPFGKDAGKFEQLILDCLSKSIFENFPKIRYIYFTVNGEAYHSGKLKLSTMKPYMTNE